MSDTAQETQEQAPGVDSNVVSSTLSEKNPLKITDLPEKQQAFALLRQNGLSVREVEKALGYQPRSGYPVEKKLSKYDLTSQKMVSKAHKTIKKLMEGKTFGEIKEVKDSTALRAAECVADRAQPKVSHNVNLNLSADIDPVDLSTYMSGSNGAPVDTQGVSEHENTPQDMVEDIPKGDGVNDPDNT